MGYPQAKPRSSTKTKMIVAAVLAVPAVLVGVVLAASQNTPANAPSQPAAKICGFNSGGGYYYLLVTSATDHNFTACDGGQPYAGTIDRLLGNGSGFDRRCILGPAATAKYDAIVAVYSSPAQVDLDAAKAFCTANGGDEPVQR